MKKKAIAWQIHIQRPNGYWEPVNKEFGYALPKKIIRIIESYLARWYDINPEYMFKKEK